ncbi:MAG: WG repeat-containing protein [Alistipes sp.]|nr:WG repeat-containing protein [Alistipes sp.]
MKRLFILVVLVCATIGSASAQKRDVVALTEEINALKAREVELQNKINALMAREEAMHKHIDSLNNEVNKLVRAYTSLEEAYDNKSQKIDSLCVKFDRLIAATEALPQLNFEQSYGSLLAKIDTLTEALNNQATTAQSQSYEIVGDIHCGLVAIRQGTKYGFINVKGEIVIAPKYEEVTDFRLNRAAFRLNDKWGIIDTNGKVIVAAQFDAIDRYCYEVPFYSSRITLYKSYDDKSDKTHTTTRDNPVIKCRKGYKEFACFIKDGRIVEANYFHLDYWDY